MGLFDNLQQLTPLNLKFQDWDSLTYEEKDKYDSQMPIYSDQ